MQCPECGGRGFVASTHNFGTTVLRYRFCRICGHRWKAWEEADKSPVRVQKRRGTQDDLFASEVSDVDSK